MIYIGDENLDFLIKDLDLKFIRYILDFSKIGYCPATYSYIYNRHIKDIERYYKREKCSKFLPPLCGTIITYVYIPKGIAAFEIYEQISSEELIEKLSKLIKLKAFI